MSPAMAAETMTKDEKSCLLYIETCCVDRGGLLEGCRLNAADHAAIGLFKTHGLLTRAGRIPAKLLKNSSTHYAELSDAGWELAHQLRRWRARPEARFPSQAAIFEAITEREARDAEGTAA